MKKGFISALFVSLLMAVPAIVQAEENEKPLLPLELTNVLTETVQELEPQNVDSDPELQAASIIAAEGVGQSQKQESGLLNIDLDFPVIGEVEVDLLAGGKAESESENTTSSQNCLLGVEIKNSELLGDVNLEVLKRNEQGEREASSSGLVSLDVDSALLGKTHIGVLEGDKSSSSEQTNIAANLIVIESKDSLLGSKRVGVGEYKNNNGQQKVKLADIRDDDTSDVISNSDTQFGNTATEKGNHTSKENISKSLVVANRNRENKVADDARKSTVLNQQKENVLEGYKKIINQVNESEKNTIKLVASSGVAPGNGPSGASSGSGAANSSGGVTGLAAYLAVDYLKEIETCCHVNNGSYELSDQWQQSPPGDPPKAPFFLIA